MKKERILRLGQLGYGDTDVKIMELVVGKPSNGLVHAKNEWSTISALFKTDMTAMLLVYPRSCYIHEGRMEIAEEAVRSGFSHLIFIDADMVFPVDSINILASRDKDIIGVDYNKRGAIPLASTVVPLTERKKYAPFKCKSLGTGLLLIKISVFNKIPQPWFFYEHVEGSKFVGEDIWFCNKAREVGIEVWCDPTFTVKHIGDYEY